MGTELSKDESKRLASLEHIVEQGKQGFVAVGHALLEIRESRLYREQSDTFESYCQIKWGFTRHNANRLIQAAEIVSEFGDHGHQNEPAPTNERQARALAAAPPEDRKSVWKEAVASAPKDKKTGKPKVTAKDVQKVVAKRAAPKEEKPTGPWGEFRAAMMAEIDILTACGKRLQKIMQSDASAKKLNEKFAHFYSYTGTLGNLKEIIRSLLGGLPAAASDKPPGFVPQRSVDMERKAG